MEDAGTIILRDLNPENGARMRGLGGFTFERTYPKLRRTIPRIHGGDYEKNRVESVESSQSHAYRSEIYRTVVGDDTITHAPLLAMQCIAKYSVTIIGTLTEIDVRYTYWYFASTIIRTNKRHYRHVGMIVDSNYRTANEWRKDHTSKWLRILWMVCTQDITRACQKRTRTIQR